MRTFGMEKIDSSISHIHSVTAKTSSFFQNVFSLNFINAAAFSGGRSAIAKKTDKTDHIEIFVIVQPENTRDKEGFERIRNKFPAAQTTLGITAAEWPKNIKEADWAVARLNLNKEFFDTKKYHYSSKFMKELERTPDSLANMPWIGLIDERNPKTGKLTKDRMGIALALDVCSLVFTALERRPRTVRPHESVGYGIRWKRNSRQNARDATVVTQRSG